jgi:hypothetical protein
VPDDQDYADLGQLLSQPEQWSDADAARARRLRDHQAQAAADYDQRDRVRVAAMWGVVQQLDEALAVLDGTR